METAKAECCQQLLPQSQSVSNKSKKTKYIFKVLPLPFNITLTLELLFYRSKIKTVYNLLGDNFHVISGGNDFNNVTDLFSKLIRICSGSGCHSNP